MENPVVKPNLMGKILCLLPGALRHWSASLPNEPSVEEPKEEKPPTESWDPTRDQKREDNQGAAEIQVPDLEADLNQLSQSKTGDKCGDGPDVQGKILPKSDQFKMPGEAEGKPQV
nr:X antigen family member 5-like [Aotus nancymaae]